MARFLFPQWDGGGSLPPELTIVRRLIEAGHGVTVLGDPVTEPEVRAAGVTDFRTWVQAPHHVTRRPEDDYMRDWEVRNPLNIIPNMLDKLFVGPAPLFAAETLAAIDDVQPDAVVTSFPLFGSMMAAEVRGLPCAALVPNVVSLPVEGMPPFGTGLLPAKSRLGRARDRAFNGLVDRLWNKAHPSSTACGSPWVSLRSTGCWSSSSGPTASWPSPPPHLTSRPCCRRTSATSARSSTSLSGPSRGPRPSRTTGRSSWSR